MLILLIYILRLEQGASLSSAYRLCFINFFKRKVLKCYYEIVKSVWHFPAHVSV